MSKVDSALNACSIKSDIPGKERQFQASVK
jgi:hypothetical protein